MSRPGFAVLISGSGTNLQALIDSSKRDSFPGQLSVVISNRRDAFGLERAREAGLPALWIPHRKRSREDFEQELIEILNGYGVEWVALAGFMRILSPHFLSAFPGRVLNIHPSLLPAFPGMDAQRQAWEHGARIAGATVHLVDSGTDTGPVIIQGAVPVQGCSGLEELKRRILSVEHRIYTRALAWALAGEISVEKGRVQLPDGAESAVWCEG
jgi:phosphoribosylglycinamide formyltransferase 1